MAFVWGRIKRYNVPRNDLKAIVRGKKRFYGVGLKRRRLNATLMNHFSERMFGKAVPIGDMTKALSEVMENGSGKEVVAKVLEAIGPLREQTSEHGRSTRDNPTRTVNYTGNELSTGHFFMTSTYMEIRDGWEHLANPQTAGSAIDGFPGGFVLIPDWLYEKIVKEGIAPAEAIKKYYPEVLKHTQEIANRKQGVSGYCVLGGQSIVRLKQVTAEIGGVRVQVVEAKTTQIHLLVGSALWIFCSDPKNPHAILGITVHLGINPLNFGVNFGDRVNFHVAPSVAHNTIVRGLTYVEHKEALRKELGSKVDCGQLDPNVAKAVWEIVERKDCLLNVNASLLTMTQQVGDVLMGWLRLWAPDGNIYLSVDRLKAMKTPEQKKDIEAEGHRLGESLGSTDREQFAPFSMGEEVLWPEMEEEHERDGVELERRIRENTEAQRTNETQRHDQQTMYDDSRLRRLEEERRWLEREERRLEAERARHEEIGRRMEERRREEQRRRR